MEFRTYLESIENQYTYFVEKLALACKYRNAVLKTIGKVKQYDLYQVTINPKAKETIGLIGAVHGDEIVGPHAILKFMEESDIPKDKRIIIFPVANPIGFDKQTRSATDRLNINRQFHKHELENESKLIKNAILKEDIDLFCAFHEDSLENAGFYIYTSTNAEDICQEIVKVMKKFLPIDNRKVIYGDDAKKGIITVKVDNKNPQNRKSLDTWVNKLGIKTLCAEFPTRFPLGVRADAGRALIDILLQFSSTTAR